MGTRGPQNHLFRLNALSSLTVALCAVAITAHAATLTVTNTDDSGRVFHISAETTVAISGLTIRNGMVTGDFPAGSGGGIYSFQATLTLNDCAIIGNSASYGGGIANDAYNDEEGGPWAILTISNSTLSRN